MASPTDTEPAARPRIKPDDADHPATLSTDRAMRYPHRIAIFFGIVVLTLAADLLIKAWSFESVADTPIVLTPETVADGSAIPRHEPITLIPKVLSLRLVANQGAVFGIGSGKRTFFVLLSVVAVGVIVWLFLNSASTARWTHLCLALILAGALGNLYDRIRFHAVRDMFNLFPDVHLPFGWRWGNGSSEIYPWVFNVADVALVVGVIVLMGILFKADMPPRNERQAGR